MAYKVVIEVPLGKARVGVVRGDDGWLKMFPGLVGDEGGVVLEDFLPHGERVDGRTVVAGRVPEGVARVVVIDDRGDEYEATLGDEAWVAVAGEAGSPSSWRGCEDAAGVLVPRPIPDGPRIRCPGVDAVCPICARVGVGRGRRGRVLRALRPAGRGGTWPSSASTPSDYEDLVVEDVDDDDEDDEWEAEERRERQQIVAALTFPLYGMPSHAWEIGGYGGNPDKGINHVDLQHGDTERSLADHVQEARAGGPRRTACGRRFGASSPTPGYDFDRSDAADPCAQHGRHSGRATPGRAGRELETAPRSLIDGAPEPFTFLGLDDVWVAHREHFGVTVKLASRRLLPAHRSSWPRSRARPSVRGAGSACAGRPSCSLARKSAR